MDTGLNTIEFYSGDISGNFANCSRTRGAVGGAQDNGPSSVTFRAAPTGPVQWQMGLGGDGFSGRIDPVGTGPGNSAFRGQQQRRPQPMRHQLHCRRRLWTSSRGGWTGDQQSFVLPIDIFHGGIPGGDDCLPAGSAAGAVI